MIVARSAKTGSSGLRRRKRRQVPRLLLGQPAACSYSHGFAHVLWLVSFASEIAISYLKMPDQTVCACAVCEKIELNLAMGCMDRVSQRTKGSKGPLRSFGTDRTRSIALLIFDAVRTPYEDARSRPRNGSTPWNFRRTAAK